MSVHQRVPEGMVHVLPFFGSQDIGLGPCHECHDAPCARSAAGAHASHVGCQPEMLVGVVERKHPTMDT